MPKPQPIDEIKWIGAVIGVSLVIIFLLVGPEFYKNETVTISQSNFTMPAAPLTLLMSLIFLVGMGVYFLRSLVARFQYPLWNGIAMAFLICFLVTLFLMY